MEAGRAPHDLGTHLRAKHEDSERPSRLFSGTFDPEDDGVADAPPIDLILLHGVGSYPTWGRCPLNQQIPTQLSLEQSVLVAWPQIVLLVAIIVALFVAAYVAFLRQEVRA